MRALITGAGGFVGPHVCRALADDGHDVIAAARRPLEMPGSSPLTLDVMSPPDVARAVEDTHPDAIVHLAARSSTGGSWDAVAETMAMNVGGAGNVLAAASEHAPNARILLIGSAHQYGGDREGPLRESDPQAPETPYAISKSAQEMLGLAWAGRGLDVVMTRSFNHTGPGAPSSTAAGAFCAQIAAIEDGRTEAVVRTGDLSAERDFVDVRDVAAAYLRLLEGGEGGTIYNVGSGTSVAVREILRLALEASTLSDPPRIEEASTGRVGDPSRLVADITALSALGWSPALPLDRSIADTLASHRATTASPS